jgi:hypothetical protein
MVADDLELAMVVEVSNEPLGSSGCYRRCRCCGSFVVAEMALKPKSKHKGVGTKTKNEGCCQNFGQAELPVLRGGTSGPSGRNFRSQSDLRAVHRFGRKSGPKSFEFEENLALEAVGRWGNCRSTPKTSFYWSKTTNNSTNREIDPRPI